jgi:predicted heme/steroid binding protein
LTEALAEAPHGADLLDRCPIVGILVSTLEERANQSGEPGK